MECRSRQPEPTSEVGGPSAAGLRGAGVSGQRLRYPWDRPAATSRSTSVSPQGRPRPLLTVQGRAGQHWHCLSLRPPPAWHSALPSGPHSLQLGRGTPESTRTPGGPRPAAVGQLLASRAPGPVSLPRTWQRCPPALHPSLGGGQGEGPRWPPRGQCAQAAGPPRPPPWHEVERAPVPGGSWAGHGVPPTL